VAEWGNSRVQEVDPMAATHLGFWFVGEVSAPQAVAWSPTLLLAAVSQGNTGVFHCVTLFDMPAGVVLRTIGTGPGCLMRYAI
jgi:hypothetical protein